MRYRPDIDGLRAFAVSSVIFYHLDPSIIPAGFIGVDIFFVISGYLITLQILNDFELDRFSLLEFYRRRVKRIAPAMLVVLGVTLLFAQLMFRPEDAEKVARASFWSLLNCANIYFWLSDDGAYFSTPSDQLPLLHFWSLAVEEQYYILWPLALLLFRNFVPSWQFIVALIAIAALSFALGQIYFIHDASFVYYMLPTRAGELLVGCALAWWVKHSDDPVPFSSTANHIIAAVAAILVAASLFVISEQDEFPGFSAMIPTIGTAALIFTGYKYETWPKSLLMLPLIVWVGKLSYSAYLWHWPVLAFLRYSGINISALIGIAVVITTFGIAWLSYTYIELPFRKTQRGALVVVSQMYVLPAAALGVLALASLKTDGLILHRFFPSYISQLEQTRELAPPAYRVSHVCQRRRISAEDLKDPECVLGPPDRPTSAILWGDSNASHYIGLIQKISEVGRFQFRNIEVDSCPPLRSNLDKYVTARRAEDCRYSNHLIWPVLKRYQTIIISASWTDYEELSHDFFEEFEMTIDLLEKSSTRIILLGKAPIIHDYDRLCREKALRIWFMNCTVRPVPLDDDVIVANDKLKSIAEGREKVWYFDANDYLCPDNVCSVKDPDGMIRYYDRSHLTLEASRRLGTSIIQDTGVPDAFSDLVE